jgi:hypothetical protein
MQDFRFCLRCQRVALIECEKCIFCKGGFLIEKLKKHNHNEYMKKWYNKQKNKV